MAVRKTLLLQSKNLKLPNIKMYRDSEWEINYDTVFMNSVPYLPDGAIDNDPNLIKDQKAFQSFLNQKYSIVSPLKRTLIKAKKEKTDFTPKVKSCANLREAVFNMNNPQPLKKVLNTKIEPITIDYSKFKEYKSNGQATISKLKSWCIGASKLNLQIISSLIFNLLY